MIRGVIVLSAVLAALAEAYLSTPYFPPSATWIAAAIGAALALAGHRVRRPALAVLLPLLYVLPALMLAWVGNENFSIEYVWFLPLLGLALSGPGAWQWSLPAAWRWPLLTWALVAAVSWPIVFFREADFRWWTLWVNASNSSIGISPGEANQHVTYFAVIYLLGVLWIDALCRWYRDDRARFVREVAWPLAAAAALGSSVAIYQGFVDLTFLNRGFWTYMLRAAGTHGDPNKLGAVAAFWTIGTMVLALRLAAPWRRAAMAGSLAIGLGAVWISGSRTGLAAVGVGLALGGVAALRDWRARQGPVVDVRRAAIGGAAMLALAVAIVIGLRGASTHTVVERGALGYLPFVGDRGVVNSVNELLWERFGYGPAAIEMVKSHPVDGVGMGMFHTLAHDFGALAGYDIPPDNAQNWFRHVVAELGFAGVVPIVWWCVVLAWLLFARGPVAHRLSFGLLRGALVGFGVASIFGMPGQSLSVTLTFWAFVFWILQERGGEAPAPRLPARLVSAAPAIAAAVIVIHAATTAVDARGDLRPRHRAERFDWPYVYGWLALEPDPGGHPIPRRWTRHEAVAVIPVKGSVLKFVAWIDHPDGDERPPHVRVRADGRVIHDGPLMRSTPLFADIPARPGATHMVLDTWIDRMYRPADHGSADRRALGLSVRDWNWE